jgi:DNA-binding transcriptional MerR regulator
MNGLRSGQVARAAGVSRQTLRYYERRGLTAEPHRTPGGHRLYPAEMVTVLRAIKAAQRLGFSLAEITDLLETGSRRSRRSRRSHPGGRLAQQAPVKLAEVEAKIAELTVIADTLRAALDAGCKDLIDCAGQPQCPLPFAGLGESGAAAASSC